MRAKVCVLLAAAVGVVCVAAMSAAAATDSCRSEVDPQQYKQTVQRGIAYLTTKGQAEDGSYSAKVSPAVTALCVSALFATACRRTIRRWPRA